MTPASLLESVSFPSHFRPRYGHCKELALALYDVCGGDLVAISDVPGGSELTHVLVRVNGTVYDGTGSVTLASLYHEYTPANRGSVEDHIHEPSYERVMEEADFDHEVYSRAMRQLRDAKRRAGG